MAGNFPTVDDFKSAPLDGAVTKWRDLELGVFRIVSKRPTRNKFGPGMLLELEDADGEISLSWAPARLVQKLSDDKTINYVLNEGLKQSPNDPSKSYFSFSTLAAP